MGTTLEDTGNNLECVLINAPTFVMYKFGQNLITTAVTSSGSTRNVKGCTASLILSTILVFGCVCGWQCNGGK